MEPPADGEFQSPPQSQHHTSSSSRGRNPSRQQVSSPTTYNANTPKRKGNPQSSSPSVDQRSPRQEQQSLASGESVDFSLTPLSTLSTILATHSAHERTALMLFRQSHALHLTARERSSLAIEKLRAAQAEVEHATTAKEFAKEELDRASIQKTEAHDALQKICKSVRTLSKDLSNKRVRLVGLNMNVHWNGRLGTIIKLITAGEDVGRWKVRLDSEWRGRDADGDTGEQGEESNDSDVVVAKAENLALVSDDEVFGLFESQQQSASVYEVASSNEEPESLHPLPSNHTSPLRRSRDPSVSTLITSTGPKRRSRLSSVNTQDKSAEETKEPENDRRHNQHRNDKIDGDQNREPVPYSPAILKISTPIKRCPSSDSGRISTAFSLMMQSPVSCTAASFNPISTTNFQRWMQGDDSQHHNNESFEEWMQEGSDIQNRIQDQQRELQSVNENHRQFIEAGSFFNELTSLKKDSFPSSHNDNESDDKNYNEWEDSSVDPKLHVYPSPQEIVMHDSSTADDYNLPQVVLLDEDDQGNSMTSLSSPAYCVGVQNAYSHVNGVYVLAYPKDDNGNVVVHNEGESDMPPLYFKDGPPTLLSDNRYYDMCILRIDCPDSADHIIWFMAKVDVDPDCLDVKFSDCYYYCRMHRNDDGYGGLHEGGCLSPPSKGWNLPKVGSHNLGGEQSAVDTHSD